MFAGATREVVFSNPEVVRRVNKEFIPVALKAGLVNNPPGGIEGELYAEIGRSKPAPQGICTLNSAGKVLTWALSFDEDASIVRFLDHVAKRYHQSPNSLEPVVAERFRKFPSRKLADVEDTQVRITVPEQHSLGDRCPAKPALEQGTLVGRIIGRPLDDSGKPIADTIRQEHYMESRFELPVSHQEQFVAAAKQAEGKRFRIPSPFARDLVRPAFLGQLDVNPLGGVPGSRNDAGKWEFSGQAVPTADSDIVRIHIDGESHVEGGRDEGRNLRSDGRMWEHRVTLTWQGYVDCRDNRVTQLVMAAHGDERLRWGNARFHLRGESDAEHLMAGHPIDLECTVRYGLFAEPCRPEEVVEGAVARRPSRAPPATLRTKMQRLQAGVKRLRRSGNDPSNIARLMQRFGPLMRQQEFTEAESLLDDALELLEDKSNTTRNR